MNDSEFGERGRLIGYMLDKLYPIDPDMPVDVREGVEADRQMLALRAGWGTMPIETLREIASK